jgi:plastocyanin
MKRFITTGVALLFAAPALAADIKVGMAGSTYSPATIKAKVGDTLVFENDDFTNHWVFVPTAGYSFDLGNQKEKEMRRYTLKKPGKFEIECVVHPAMKIMVEVTQ